jgi:predicted enzyme related to lactoylglutathione lyase
MADQFREQGAFSWFELTTTDVRAAETFYSRVFGWTMEPWTGEGSYTLIKVNGKEVGGMVMGSVTSPKPYGWGIYVTVTDVDETAAKVPEFGGKVLLEPTDIPRVGRFCVIEDPLGAVITAITYCRG